ncbi:SIR2-like protein [Microcella alkaliphila]|uniref:SIR2-like protein n=1 Tax=Microcella alkaliphila TaxID=279828 RepID=A0A4Q7TV15_9MICO|nr:SIR2 family protein [Microcella alkaliphila]RZT63898.1 SIR2-like protein [Microcella alkaliphila]
MADTPAPHVFVVQGDLTRIACDAWLLPTDQRINVKQHWRDALPTLAEQLQATDLMALRVGDRLAAALAPAVDEPDAPRIIATAVPLHGFDEPAELFPALRAFVAEAVAATASRPRTRPLPLFALPFFGTAGGGGANRRGAIFDALHAEARELAARYEVDLAFVFASEPSFALAQRRRQQNGALAGALPEHLIDHAHRLAAIARDGRLVPFLGAGVSVSAGAPTWDELISSLGAEAGLDGAELASITRVGTSPLDQAAYLRMRFEQTHGTNAGPAFQRAIASIVERPRYGLAPALLASLESEQAITLNYDELFEFACADAGKPRRVIPGTDSTPESWLLKLHGTVTDPSTIVLTRDDYLGFNSERGALSALVKATLMTRHLLFVGFGLRDDHFHEIVHDVRRAVGTSTTGPAATALTMSRDPLHDALWSGQLSTVAMNARDDSGDVPNAGRTLEIFLDAVICKATDSHSFLLKAEFEEALSDDEKRLASALRQIETAFHGLESTTLSRQVSKFLTRLGHDQDN